jgi:hypothetical protein
MLAGNFAVVRSRKSATTIISSSNSSAFTHSGSSVVDRHTMAVVPKRRRHKKEIGSIAEFSPYAGIIRVRF